MKEKRSDICDAKHKQPRIHAEGICMWGPKNKREQTLLRKEIKKQIKNCAVANGTRPAEQEDTPSVSQSSTLSHSNSGSHSLASLRHFNTFRKL